MRTLGPAQRASLSAIPLSYRQRPDQVAPFSLAFCAALHSMAWHTLLHEALLPAPHTRLRNAGGAHDLHRATPLRRRQNNPCPPNMVR
jgi:hypothetical protein